MKRFQDVFSRYCSKDRHAVSLQDVPAVALELGLASGSEELHNIMQPFYKKVSENHITWNQFLLLSRHIFEQQAKQRKQQEIVLAEQLGLSIDMKKQVRDVFDSYVTNKSNNDSHG